MLVELSIRNIALIERLRVVFEPGLNVLTGETGAGKSIVVDSVNLALGARATRELVRTGADRAVVQAVFDMPEGASEGASEGACEGACEGYRRASEGASEGACEGVREGATGRPKVAGKACGMGVEAQDDLIVLTREIAASGRLRSVGSTVRRCRRRSSGR